MFDEQLRFAIANRRLIQITYHRAARIVEPHDYGVQKGKDRLLVFQRQRLGGGPRKSGDGWKLLHVEEIEQCVVLDDTFPGSRGASHTNHNAWDVVYARVD